MLIAWKGLKAVERVKLITDLWTPQSSADKLAKAISAHLKGKVTRSAVIGIYDRNPDIKMTHPLAGRTFVQKEGQLAPAGRGPGYRRHGTHSRPAAPFKAAPKLKRKAEHLAFDKLTRFIPLDQVKAGECHWAVNDAEIGESHLFCGLPTEDGHRYCPHHKQRSIK